MKSKKPGPARKLLLTISFATRLPLASVPDDSTQLTGLGKYLPASGLVIGLLLAGFIVILQCLKASILLAATLTVIAWLTITGGIHMDGLMDTADGIFSHRSRQRMIEIMSDSRVGNFGAMSGFCLILVKIAACAALFPTFLSICILFIPAWARWCELIAIGRHEYAKKSGMGKVWHESTVFPRDAVQGMLPPLVCTILAVFMGYKLPVFVAVVTIAAGILCGAWLNEKLGGHTGDSYGAVVEISEAAGLAATACLSSLPSFQSFFI